MFRPLGINIGLRYGFSRRSFIAHVSSLAIFGLALSIAVLIVVLSVINGFERELQNRILGIMPHVSLRARGAVREDDTHLKTLRALPGVVGAASYLQGPVLLATQSQVRGAVLNGIKPSDYAAVSQLADYVEPQALAQLETGGFKLILGAGLADQLGVGVGAEVTLVMPEARVSPMGLHPRQRRFEVIGLLRSASELDQTSAFTNLNAAARMFRAADGIHGYQLRLLDLFDAERVARSGLAVLGTDFFATTWMRTHGNLYRAIGVQKLTMFVLLSFLVAVAAFNLIATLVMVVNERRADVAVLRTLGSSTWVVVLTFVTLGLVIGLLGVLLGIGAGVLVGILLERGFAFASEQLGWDLLSQYFVNYLPVEIRSSDIAAVALTALGLCFVSTLLPAWRAARLLPTRVLKYE